MGKLRIALYQPWVYQKGGMERVILEMTSPKSRHDWTIFTNHYDPKGTFEEFKNRKVVELKRVSVRRTPLDLLKVTAIIAAQKLPLDGFDVLVVSTAGFGEFITLRNHSLPIACFCHTPLRVIHDPAAHHDLLKHKMHTLPAYLAFEAAYRALEKRAWKHFSKVACNSLETRRRILRAGLAYEKDIIIAHPGVHVSGFKPSKEFGKYFFLPGRISKLKNNLLAIEAFKQFRVKAPRAAKGLKLVIAGGVGEKDLPYLKELKAAAGNDKSIIFRTDVSDKELFSLYGGSFAVLFTALNEDWGIVPLEAMAFGKPVIAVNEGGPRESVIDGKTGFLVPGTSAAFAGAMADLAKNPSKARKMGANGRQHVGKFDWSYFVSAIDSMVEGA
jgi:glycosyltransferase involved in cell wall biosynthesis